MDVNCGGSPTFYTQHVCDAVAKGSVQQSDVDRAARRYWRTMMRLGARPEPFNFTPMGAESISPAHPHVRPMWRTERTPHVAHVHVHKLAKSRKY